MKTIFRILVILAAAAIVGGIIFALVGNNTSNLSSGYNRRGGTEFRPSDNTGFRPDENGNFVPRSDHNREEFGGGFFFPAGMIKGLLVVSVIMIIWLNAEKLFRKVKTVQTK